MATDLRTQRLPALVPMNVEEWAKLDPDLGYELVNGRLVRKPDVAVWHDLLVARLLTFLNSFVWPRKVGEFTAQKSRIKISDLGGREPDLFFIPRTMYHLVTLNLFRGVPSLVVEVLSPSNIDTDRIDKYEEYARLGIPEYWIVDFPNRCLEVHRLVESPDGSRSYQLADAHRGDAIFRPTLFPGLEIPLADLWPTEFENALVD